MKSIFVPGSELLFPSYGGKKKTSRNKTFRKMKQIVCSLQFSHVF